MDNDQAIIERYTYKELGKPKTDLKIESKCAQIEIKFKEGKMFRLEIYGKEKGNEKVPFPLGNTPTLRDSCDHKKWVFSLTNNREDITKVFSESNFPSGEYEKSSISKAHKAIIFGVGDQAFSVSFGTSGEVNDIFVCGYFSMVINGEGKVTVKGGNITKTDICMSPKLYAMYPPNWRSKFKSMSQ